MPREFPRKLRLNVQLQRELTAVIREELTDPRIRGITVTMADVAPDLRQAKICVSMLGTDDELKQAVTALNHASGRLRRELGVRLRLRYTPQLHFSADTALREGDRISAMIRNAVRSDDANNAASESTSEPEGS